MSGLNHRNHWAAKQVDTLRSKEHGEKWEFLYTTQKQRFVVHRPLMYPGGKDKSKDGMPV
ncbi:hypothetical protein N39L_36750 [Limnospira platensis NIES-39]|nr:hypothetical protein AP285_16855 [Arthrospira platensis YZ]BDT13952.1 hypothetical protein N39L_36750 [Arthrospira platensis NIES-39]